MRNRTTEIAIVVLIIILAIALGDPFKLFGSSPTPAQVVAKWKLEMVRVEGEAATVHYHNTQQDECLAIYTDADEQLTGENFCTTNYDNVPIAVQLDLKDFEKLESGMEVKLCNNEGICSNTVPVEGITEFLPTETLSPTTTLTPSSTPTQTVTPSLTPIPGGYGLYSVTIVGKLVIVSYYNNSETLCLGLYDENDNYMRGSLCPATGTHISYISSVNAFENIEEGMLVKLCDLNNHCSQPISVGYIPETPTPTLTQVPTFMSTATLSPEQLCKMQETRTFTPASGIAMNYYPVECKPADGLYTNCTYKPSQKSILMGEHKLEIIGTDQKNKAWLVMYDGNPVYLTNATCS